MFNLTSFEIFNNPTPLSDSDIVDIQTSVGLTLPEGYRNFLKIYNMISWPSLYYRDNNGTEREIAKFLAYRHPVKSCNLLMRFEDEKDWLPAGRFPFGTGSGGCLLSLSLNKEDYGSVWVRDSRLSFGNMFNPKANIKVSDTFSEFLAQLKDEYTD